MGLDKSFGEVFLVEEKSTGGACTGWCWYQRRCRQVGLHAARRRRRRQRDPAGAAA